ncbi:MAG TPA: hypothetical protein VLZ81_10180 [Blastocatellia bacterium]|nr:hypothetical protein [Blastocatellia bacterium]
MDRWTATNLTDAPAARTSHTAVWTGSEMIIWGGECCDSGIPTNTGARYDPASDTWTATTLVNGTGAPNPRFGHNAVWAGDQMIIYGGFSGGGSTNTGGIYRLGQ